LRGKAAWIDVAGQIGDTQSATETGEGIVAPELTFGELVANIDIDPSSGDPQAEGFLHPRGAAAGDGRLDAPCPANGTAKVDPREVASRCKRWRSEGYGESALAVV